MSGPARTQGVSLGLLRGTSVGVGPRIHRVVKQVVQRRQRRPPPHQLATLRPVLKAHAQSDVVPDQIVQQAIDRAQLIELVEEQPHDITRLLIGVEGHPTGRQLDVPEGDPLEQLTAQGLVEPATLQAVPHDDQLIFTHDPTEPEQQSIVGVIGVVDTVFIRQDRSDDGTHLQEIVPIPVVAGDAAHLDPEDQANMLHRNFGQDATKSAPRFRRPGICA